MPAAAAAAAAGLPLTLGVAGWFMGVLVAVLQLLLLLLPTKPWPAAAAAHAVLPGGFAVAEKGVRSSSWLCAKKQKMRLQCAPSRHILVLYLHTVQRQAAAAAAALRMSRKLAAIIKGSF
jgi:hypothetical protein